MLITFWPCDSNISVEEDNKLNSKLNDLFSANLFQVDLWESNWVHFKSSSKGSQSNKKSLNFNAATQAVREIWLQPVSSRL